MIETLKEIRELVLNEMPAEPSDLRQATDLLDCLIDELEAEQ